MSQEPDIRKKTLRTLQVLQKVVQELRRSKEMQQRQLQGEVSFPQKLGRRNGRDGQERSPRSPCNAGKRAFSHSLKTDSV